MPSSLDKAFGIHADALKLRSQRAGVLASNLANADTPNYKARDLDFKQVLAGQRGEGLVLSKTSRQHLPAGDMDVDAGFKYRVPMQASLDGNTVDTEIEHAAFAENTIQYQASLEFLGSKIQGLLKALRGE